MRRDQDCPLQACDTALPRVLLDCEKHTRVGKGKPLDLGERAMHRQSRFSLVLMFLGVAALTALTGLRADNPRPKENSGTAEKAKAANSSAAAVKPKPLASSVEKALAYLAGQQQSSGGWGQGGGWRNDLQSGGRIEGANVADPADVAN